MPKARFSVQVRQNNAHTTILLLKGKKVVGVNRDEVRTHIAVALRNPQSAVAWDYNPVPDPDPINPADLTKPEQWGEMLTADDIHKFESDDEDDAAVALT